MILVDSHCHLDCLDLTSDNQNLAKIIQRANARGVDYFLCVCITQDAFQNMAATVQGYPSIFLSVGTHPNEQLEQEPTTDELMRLASLPQVVAIGETGLDYYRTTGDVSWQQTRFRQHIQVAKATKKPLIVHSRCAREDTIRLLKEEKADEVGGVLHCFSENLAMAEQAMALNFLISFSGILTFANAKELQEVAKQVPLSHALIETDSPYLAPVPFRGKANAPEYVYYVAEKLAEIKQEPIETIAQHTTDNFFTLFKQARKQ